MDGIRIGVKFKWCDIRDSIKFGSKELFEGDTLWLPITPLHAREEIAHAIWWEDRAQTGGGWAEQKGQIGGERRRSGLAAGKLRRPSPSREPTGDGGGERPPPPPPPPQPPPRSPAGCRCYCCVGEERGSGRRAGGVVHAQLVNVARDESPVCQALEAAGGAGWDGMDGCPTDCERRSFTGNATTSYLPFSVVLPASASTAREREREERRARQS
uniref:Uncharacterized protein n=1 Tax=Oryza glumipatula TaxID=40148 RepID=A0A0E0ATV5_9ORYZ